MSNYPTREDLELVALDLDGTVICSRGQSPISERTVRAIAGLQESGLPVTFVTGRTEDYALPIARRFGLRKPLVTYNGARLVCPLSGEVLYRALLPNSVAASIASWLALTDEVVAVYLNRERSLHLIQNRCSGRPSHDDYLFGTPRHLVGELARHVEDGAVSVSKMIVSTQRDLASEVSDRFGPVAQVVRTHPELVEVLPLGVTKGDGVARLCERLGVELGRVLAVGDQDNDLSTFERCGYSVAMGDAPEHVKEQADFVTASFEEDGCALALEKVLYGAKPFRRKSKVRSKANE